jgi:uncharacterized membrane protein (DUF4010 family)
LHYHFWGSRSRAAQLVCAGRPAAQTSARVEPSNPLELSVAALFAVLFVAISIASPWAADHFGAASLFIAAIVGVTEQVSRVLTLKGVTLIASSVWGHYPLARRRQKPRQGGKSM